MHPQSHYRTHSGPQLASNSYTESRIGPAQGMPLVSPNSSTHERHPSGGHPSGSSTTAQGGAPFTAQRSRPLPIPERSKGPVIRPRIDHAARAQSLSTLPAHHLPKTNTFESSQGSLSNGLRSSRPLPTAPGTGHIRDEGSVPSSGSSTQRLPPHVSVRDRIHALQPQVTAVQPPQRRALPESPTAPPDLRQLPSGLLRRRGTLPNPPLNNLPLVNASVSIPESKLGSHSHSTSLRNIQSSEESIKPPSISPVDRDPDGHGHSSSTTKLISNTVHITAWHSDKNAGPFSVDEHRTSPHNINSRNHLVSPDSDSSSEPIKSNDSPPFIHVTASQMTPVAKRAQASTNTPPDRKPIQGGPRRMQPKKQTNQNATPHRDFTQTSNTAPSPAASNSLPKAPQSLTFRFASMGLRNDDDRGPDLMREVRDALEDSPPRSVRPLSPLLSQNEFQRQTSRSGLEADSPSSVTSDEEEKTQSRPSIPKITFGATDELDQDSSGSETGGGTSITISVSAPAISISSSETSGVPGIMEALDTSSSQTPKRHTRGQPIIRKGGLHCGGCGEGIVGRIVSAMGVRWHPSCFQCTVCGELLEHVSAYEHNGLPYCHLDYHENFAPQCFHCKTPIVDEQFITLDDDSLGKRMYHEQHFFCAECGDPFLGPSGTPDDDVGFTVYKGYAYCEACHVRLRMPKCSKCRKSIRDGMHAVEALGGKWHQECFACAGCTKPFDKPAFFQRGNKPFCEKCFSIIIKSEMD